MPNRAASHRKKGPGRRHLEGKPSGWKPDAHLFGNKLARKAFSQTLAVCHAPGYLFIKG